MTEFESIQKIWNHQKNEPMYIIEEKELRKMITSKRSRAIHWASATELLLIWMNVVVAAMLILVEIKDGVSNIFSVSLIGVMMFTAVFTFVMRKKRLAVENNFDNTMLGELNEAIDVSKYQVDMSKSIGAKYIAIVSLLSLFKMIYEGASLWFCLGLIVFIIATIFLGRWEYKSLYVTRKNELIRMREKLIKEG